MKTHALALIFFICLTSNSHAMSMNPNLTLSLYVENQNPWPGKNKINLYSLPEGQLRTIADILDEKINRSQQKIAGYRGNPNNPLFLRLTETIKRQIARKNNIYTQLAKLENAEEKAE